MSATFTKNVRQETNYTLAQLLSRGARIVVGVITFDDSYPTGGEEVDFGFTPDIVLFETDGTYWFSYDHTNETVKVYTATATEVTAETDLKAVSVRVLALKVSN